MRISVDVDDELLSVILRLRIVYGFKSKAQTIRQAIIEANVLLDMMVVLQEGQKGKEVIGEG